MELIPYHTKTEKTQVLDLKLSVTYWLVVLMSPPLSSERFRHVSQTRCPFFFFFFSPFCGSVSLLFLLSSFTRWVFLETRRLTASFPEHVRKLWTDWEVRVLVLVSLTLQLLLLHFGSRRRYSVKTWLRVFLWLAYLGADSVATVALGVISNNQRNSNDSQSHDELIAFWAPFLLLHLGGQDTITAYAVQDNELWLRHLLGLVVQSGVALYILVLSWKVSRLSFLTIPMFLAGFIKYAERTRALKSANYDQFNVHGPPIIIVSNMDMVLGDVKSGTSLEPTSPEIKKGAFQLFKLLRRLFLNQKADNSYPRDDGNFSNFYNSQTAWKTIEVELGYAYDVYYTKAPLFFTTCGFFFRFFSFASILFVFVLFPIRERHKHPVINLIITYLLLVGAIFIEIYAVILLCASDWPWPQYEHGRLVVYTGRLLTPIRNRFAKLTSKQNWSNSMGQLNLLGLCLKDKPLQDGHGTPKLFANLRERVFNKILPKLNGELEMLLYRTHKQVSAELKDSVLNTFREKLSSNSNGFSEKYDKYITNGTASLETYQSIIIWHIATDLCFYTDSGTKGGDLSRKVMSKDVSDYMMYILVMCPLVLSTGNAKHSFEQNCKTVKDFILSENLSKQPKAQVCERLISSYSARVFPIYECLLYDSLVYLAVLLAKKLNKKRGKWKILSKFWVENLAYVATLCQGNNHAQLLRKGGEFLTHVWLLKEHFNLTESFQKSQTRPQEEEAEFSSVVSDDETVVETVVDTVTGSESGGSATGSVFDSGYGYGQGSGNGSAAVSGADANTTSKTD